MLGPKKTFAQIMAAVDLDDTAKFINPRVDPSDKNNHLLKAPAVKAAQDLAAFLGYIRINRSLGTFNKPFIPLPAIAGIPISKKQVQEAQDSVRVYRDPDLTEADLNSALQIKTSHEDSTLSIDRQKEIARHAGRKVVVSTDYIFTRADFQPLKKLVKCKTIAACAPILKEDHELSERAIYVQNGKLTPAYKTEMKRRIKLILDAQLAEKVTVPIIPPMGAGDFAGGLGNECAEVLAQCIRENLQEGDYRGFKGVVLSAVTGKHKQAFDKSMKGYKGPPPCHVSAQEMTGIAIALEKAGETPGLLIADHPTRRVGNGWTVNAQGKGAQAQEETMSKHLAMYIGAQDHYLNPQVLERTHHIAVKPKPAKKAAPVVDGTVMERLGGHTSDHTQQSVTAELEGKDQQVQTTLTGMTWNLMNKGHSRADCKDKKKPYSNNPFDITETVGQYEARKEKQIDEILASVKRGTIDFAYLQEVDFFIVGKNNNTDLGLAQKRIKQRLMDGLGAAGWSFVQTDARHPNPPVKAMVTLYNKKKITYVSSENVLPEKNDEDFSVRRTGFQSIFTVNGTGGKKVALTNLHLDFETDYTESMYVYQKGQVDKGIFTIAGGDTNHAQNDGMYGLIGDWTYPTNFDCDKDGLLTTKHNKGGFFKRYDGFLVSPAGSDTRVIATEGPGKYFQENPPGSGNFGVADLDPQRPHTQHSTDYGEPWRRQVHRPAAKVTGKPAPIGTGKKFTPQHEAAANERRFKEQIGALSSAVFSNWQQAQGGDRATFTENSPQAKKVEIENKHQEGSFYITGSDGTEDKIAQTALALKKELEGNNKKPTIEIDVNDDAQAISFLSKCDDKEFIESLSAIHFRGEPNVDPAVMKRRVEDIKQKAASSPVAVAQPNKPGSSAL